MGYGGELFGDIFGYPVEISVLETIKMGYPKCVIKVSGKIGTEP